MKFVKLFLRLAIGFGFLSAVADRFGIWTTQVAWGNWENFVAYTEQITPWLPTSLIPAAAIVATVCEIVFGLGLIIGWKTRVFARLSGVLLLIFAISMAFSLGVKAPFDYSVFTASAAAFALGAINETFLELDGYLAKRSHRPYRY